MSIAVLFTSQLVHCENLEDVTSVFKKFVPLLCGYKVTKLDISSGVLTVYTTVSRDNGWGLHHSDSQLLVVNLLTGKEIYGRISSLGLGPVDLEIISNIVGIR